MADKPLTVAEAAKLAKIPESTFRFWIKRGEIKMERSPGGLMRVRESEARRLRSWLDGEDVEPSRMPHE
ncbi:excisionase family DNA-binding protein [Arthrobacter sp. RAF14]|uniref:excisionase family DNA-binding protein n=1 Tax=Arthrobacter sp. RAF14 TaxID=3233051 RepID=UPI003F90CF9F